jgi:hypothetical protein
MVDTVTLLGIGAKVFSGVSSPGGSDVPFYAGYSESTLQYTSTAWAGLHNILTFIDDIEFNITRNNSDFTFTERGVYLAALSVNAGALSSILVFRWMEGITTKSTFAGWAGGAPDSPQMTFQSILSVNADNEVLTLEYCRQGGVNNSFTGPIVVDGETLATMRLSIFRVGNIVA